MVGRGQCLGNRRGYTGVKGRRREGMEERLKEGAIPSIPWAIGRSDYC